MITYIPSPEWLTNVRAISVCDDYSDAFTLDDKVAV